MAFDKGFVEQFLEAIMNREPTGFSCNLGIQHIVVKLLSSLPLEGLRRVLYSKLSLIISSWFLFIFLYVLFPVSKVPIFFQNKNSDIALFTNYGNIVGSFFNKDKDTFRAVNLYVQLLRIVLTKVCFMNFHAIF